MSLFTLERERILKLMDLGRRDPVEWIRRILGVQLWAKQQQIIYSVRDNRNTLVDSCQGTGKTFSMAATGLAFLFNYPHSRVISTAPTFRQVKSILWPEVHRQHAAARVELGGTLNLVELEITDGWYFAGLSTNKPERFQGHHADYILFLVDETYGVPAPIFDAIRGAMSTGRVVRLLAAGNPTDPGAYVVEASRKAHPDGRPVWNRIHIAAWDSPNFKEFGITRDDVLTGKWSAKWDGKGWPYPHLINPEFVAEMLAEWGVGSPAWNARIEGVLPEETADTIIPLRWAEAAMERWEHSRWVDEQRAKGEPVELGPDYIPLGEPVEIGADIARYGDDETAIAPRCGRRLLYLRCYSKQDTMATVGRIVGVEDEIMPEVNEPVDGVKRERPLLKVDAGGMGVGPIDRLREMERNVAEMNPSAAPMNRKKFADITSEWWWHLRELLHPDNRQPIALPRDAKLLGDLTGRKYRITSDNKIQVEPKDQYKKRLGRSPDRGDAVVLAFAPRREIELTWLS